MMVCVREACVAMNVKGEMARQDEGETISDDPKYEGPTCQQEVKKSSLLCARCSVTPRVPYSPPFALM